MSLLAFSFFLAFIWIAVEVFFFIGGCANLGGDLNIPKNSRVSATVHPISKPQNGF